MISLIFSFRLNPSIIPLFPLLFSIEFAHNCTIMGCQNNCSITLSGPKCYCKNGYEVGEDGKMCKGEFEPVLVLKVTSVINFFIM